MAQRYVLNSRPIHQFIIIIPIKNPVHGVLVEIWPRHSEFLKLEAALHLNRWCSWHIFIENIYNSPAPRLSQIKTPYFSVPGASLRRPFS